MSSMLVAARASWKARSMMFWVCMEILEVSYPS
jgi:hypothetical protein